MPERIDGLFSTGEMAHVFSLEAHVRGMLAFEAALALSEARTGIIPQDAASSIADSCRLELTQGLIMAESLTMALAPHVGRLEAQRIVKSLCERAVKLGVHLRQAVLEEQQVMRILSLEEVEHALDPSAYLGSTNVFIERAVASYRVAKAFGDGR